MLIILFVSFVILLLIGAPIAYSMGFSSLLALILSGSTFPLEFSISCNLLQYPRNAAGF